MQLNTTLDLVQCNSCLFMPYQPKKLFLSPFQCQARLLTCEEQQLLLWSSSAPGLCQTIQVALLGSARYGDLNIQKF